MRRTSLIVVLMVMLATVVQATPAAAAPVNWSDEFPTTGNVSIPAHKTVVLDTDVNLTGLRIKGTVLCGSDSVALKARWIIVEGTFRCGTHGAPFTKRLTVTLTGNGSKDINGFGDKYIVVPSGGRFELHGKPETTWTTLERTANAGDTTIRLAENAFGVGDRLVIAPTNYYMYQAEEVAVTAKSGRTLTLSEPLAREHFCGSDKFAGKKITECAEVGLLSHNIIIQGNAASANTQVGGHFMAHHGSRVRIEDAEFRRMGQLGRLARYPIHFHHLGDSDLGAYVRRVSIHDSYNRFITIHETNGVDVQEVVGYNTIGHGFYLEDGVETGNRFLDNLAILVQDAEPATAVTPSDVDASAFWISHPDNIVNRNVAAGVGFAGFWLAFPEHPLGESYDPDIWPRRTPLGSFRNNTAHTVGFAGLYLDGGEDTNRNVVTTWYEPRQNPADPDSPHVTPELFGFTAWKSNHYGIWLRTFSGVDVVNARLADNWRSIYLANISSGPSNDNVGVITDSLMVGTTSNHGQPESWEVTDVNGHSVPKHWDPNSPLGGVPFYDGPMHVESSVFANFVPNATRDAGALTGLFPNVFSISVLNTAEDVAFKNAKNVLFPEPEEGRMGDVGIMFTDLDGSVTGIAGSQVVPDPSLLDDATCTARSAWHASICDSGYARVYVTRTDGQDVGVDVTRIGDGRQLYIAPSSAGESSFSLNIQTGTRYELDFRTGTPGGYSFWTGEFSAGGAVRIAVPAPPGSWNVTIWGVPDAEAERASIGELGSGPGGWYYEAATDLIHIRFTKDHRGGEIG